MLVPTSQSPPGSREASPTPDHIEEHHPEAIQNRLAAGFRHNYLRDFVYGAIDGAVTTFAVVCGVAGAELSPSVVIILGVANLVGDGFSMAASNYLGVRAENQLVARKRREEEEHIRLYADGEREEVRQIFAAKGFRGEELEKAVEVITSDRRRWVDTMLQEEHGLPLSGPNPLTGAAATFLAFVLVGFLPLAPYVLSLVVPGWLGADPFWPSVWLTGIAFFAVGAAKARFVDTPWLVSGGETLAVGGAAAALAYAAGLAFKGVAL